MNLVRRLRNRWKVLTGRDDTPLDGETPYWFASLLVHVGLLVAIATFTVNDKSYETIAVQMTPDLPELQEIPTLLEIEYEEEEDLGVNEDQDFQAIMDMAPVAEELAEPEVNIEQEIRDLGEFVMDDYVPEIESDSDDITIAVNGNAGFATKGTDGAVDRITHEILLSLEERKTLVVWMFDQSASLLEQRAELTRRFENVYQELGQLEIEGNEAFTKHDEMPLLTQVVAFGSRSGAMLRKPTNDVSEVTEAIGQIPIDESGIENVFDAVTKVGREYRKLSKVDRKTGEKERNVMIIIVSDECGDDIENLDAAVDICRKSSIRVFTIGIPAPFGRENTYVKWIDPDPSFDQEVQWAPVRQGPESLVPERIKLHFTENEQEEEMFDSGFGPFGLTRLCYQTGGVYFTVHPNRKLQGKVPRWETSTYSAHLSQFFDPEVMRRYRPDYVSMAQYKHQLDQNKARMALVQAGHASRVRPMQPPRLRFPKFDEAAFVNSVNLAQRGAARLAPEIDELYEILKEGEQDRDREISLRWKAGYDLAMGRVLAVKIRAESYNAMLADAKMTLKFKNEKNNTWVLRPADVISTGSQAEKLAAKARFYLERVVKEHPNTPWAVMAERELRTPIGWKWTETYTQPPQPREPRENNNNNNNQPRQPRPEPVAPVKRPPPKL